MLKVIKLLGAFPLHNQQMRLDPLCQVCREKNFQPMIEQTLRLLGCNIYYHSIEPTHIREHSDPHIKIAIPSDGSAFQAIWQTRSGQRKQQQVRSGQVCILPANLPHEVIVEHPQKSIIIDFEPEFIKQIADESIKTGLEIVEQWTARDCLIQQLGIDLQRELQQKSQRVLYIESVIQVLANHLVRYYSATPVAAGDSTSKLTPQQLQQAIDYLHEHVEQDIRLSELAGIVNMSQYRFARAFKESIGMPPHQYLLSQRIERAKQLLAKRELLIGDISYQLGFASQSHFTATFRRFTTLTPNQYRKAIRQSFAERIAASS